MADPQFSLNRSSPVPLYHQLAEALEAAIERGDLAPGDRLTNETALTSRFGVSRPTVRRAIQELVDKGFVVRKRGVGTQVIQPQVRRKMRLSSLYDDLLESGQQPTTEVLVLRRDCATDEVSRQLGLEKGEEIVRLERRRLAHGRPLALMRNWMPVAVAGDLDMASLEGSGLYALLRASGIRPRVADQRIGAKAAEASEAAMLAVEPGAALVTSTRTTYDDYGKAFEYATHLYRGDAYWFEITLVER